MGQSLEEFKLVEKIKLCYFKHRGNILAIVSDLDLDVDYIKKMVKKFKGKERREVSVLISNTLMAHLMLGYESRVHNLMEMLRKLEGRDKIEVSICCETPMEKKGEKYNCLFCMKVTSPKLMDKEGIIALKLEMLEQLREEDKSLVEFAAKMGYTNKEEVPVPKTTIKQNIVVLGTQDNKITQDLSKMTPLDRDILINKLTKEIIDVTPLKEENEK